MTPTPDIEPIREGLAAIISLYLDTFSTAVLGDVEPSLALWSEFSPAEQAVALAAADACLTYLIKRQAFLYDVYERIIAEKGLGK